MNWKENIIIKLSTFLKVNLLGIAYKSRGIGLSSNSYENGEALFVKNKLLDVLGKNTFYTFFDVGQNKGEYTNLLLGLNCNSEIHGFEPNNSLRSSLLSRYSGHSNIILNEFGLGSTEEKKELFIKSNTSFSGHSSLYRDVFNHLRKKDEINESLVQITTLENYCKKNKIKTIDFLKIDVEGHELEVLKGAGHLLCKIKVIQFELNDVHVISKVYLKDFYEILSEFDLFRLTRNGMIPLKTYTPKNEVFQIQNIIAINKKCIKQISTEI